MKNNIIKKLFIIDCFTSEDKDLLEVKRISNDMEELKTEYIHYTPERKVELLDYLKENAHSLISRININNLKDVDEYLQFLEELSDYGIKLAINFQYNKKTLTVVVS